jgi:hypothetical protein
MKMLLYSTLYKYNNHLGRETFAPNDRWETVQWLSCDNLRQKQLHILYLSS